MKINPYEYLGVPKTASIEEIRTAFREKVKRAHPDAGGNQAEFDLLKQCESILTDPERRQRYDETGDFSEKAPVNLLSMPVQSWMEFFTAMAMDNSSDPDNTDLRTSLRNYFQQQMDIALKAQVGMKIGASKYRRLAARIRKKEGENFIQQALLYQAEQLDLAQEKAANKIKGYGKAQAMLDEYEFAIGGPIVLGGKVHQGFS